MPNPALHHGSVRTPALGSGRGFTLIDLLVSIAVIALLISILIPVVDGVRESTRRVACASNQRQIGLGLQMYAIDFKSQIPPSVYDVVDDPESLYRPANPREAVRLRLSEFEQTDIHTDSWDGLGLLIAGSYLSTHEGFYCPSHSWEYSYDDMEPNRTAGVGELFGNYHLRVDLGLETDSRGRRLDAKLVSDLPPGYAIVADSIRSPEEFNHEVGANVLSADLSASWRIDHDGNLLRAIGSPLIWPTAGYTVTDLWAMLDRPADDPLPDHIWDVID